MGVCAGQSRTRSDALWHPRFRGPRVAICTVVVVSRWQGQESDWQNCARRNFSVHKYRKSPKKDLDLCLKISFDIYSSKNSEFRRHHFHFRLWLRVEVWTVQISCGGASRRQHVQSRKNCWHTKPFIAHVRGWQQNPHWVNSVDSWLQEAFRIRITCACTGCWVHFAIRNFLNMKMKWCKGVMVGRSPRKIFTRPCKVRLIWCLYAHFPLKDQHQPPLYSWLSVAIVGTELRNVGFHDQASKMRAEMIIVND